MGFYDAIVRSAELNQYQFKVTEDMKEHEDFRMLTSFISFAALRVESSITSAESIGHQSAKVNKIFRVRYWNELRRYKSLQSKILLDQSNLTGLALEEEQKFYSIIGHD